MRAVTERDFRMPEYLDAKPEEYEFRKSDNALVRKDRWERGIHSIHAIVGPRGREFEIADVIAEVEKLKGQWHDADPDDYPDCDCIDLRLSCGSVLAGCERIDGSYHWTFSKQEFDAGDFGADVIKWRPASGGAA